MKIQPIFIARCLAMFILFSTGNSFSQQVPKKKLRGIEVLPPNLKTKGKISPQAVFENFNLSNNISFQQVATKKDEKGVDHQKYQQYYRGIKVEFGQSIIHSKEGTVQAISNSVFEIENLSTAPSISATAALNSAITYIGAEQYLWDNPAEAAMVDGYSKPTGELVIFPVINQDFNSPKLAYKFDVYALKPIKRVDIYIDADNGQVLFVNNKIHTVDTPASGESLYNGPVNFMADFTDNLYSLRQVSDGNGIETYNMNNGTDYTLATDFTSSTNVFSGSEIGVQAHYGAEQTHKYFMQEHGRNSFDDTGSILKSYVSTNLIGLGYNNNINAFWDGTRMTYGDGDGVNYGPLVALDIVGHEIAHGVTEYTASLVYQNESGALNESFSDIFGESIEFFAQGTNDWLMGDAIGFGGSGGALRSMSNPNAYSDPDTYGGTHWINTINCRPVNTNDLCGVHINSGVQNYWFYLLSVGGSGTNDNGDAYGVNAIGMEKAGAIAYNNLANYLTQLSDFEDARMGSILAAIDLFGAGSSEEIAVTNAWHAVGVGEPFGVAPTPAVCDTGDITVDITFDQYADETQWRLFGPEGYIIDGRDYTSANSSTNLVETLQQNFDSNGNPITPAPLEPGEYRFVMYDAYNDGMNSGYGVGSYILASADRTIFTGGTFGFYQTTKFCIEESSELNVDTEITSNEFDRLFVTDVDGGDSDDNFELSTLNGNLRILSSSTIGSSLPNIIQIDPNTVEIPLSDITNSIIFEGLLGTNTVYLNDAISMPNQSIVFDGFEITIAENGFLEFLSLNGISNGSIELNGASINSTIPINLFQSTMTGVGSIIGGLNVNRQSEISPGTSPGIISTIDLTIQSSSNLEEDNSTFNVEVYGNIPGVDYDQVVVSNNVSLVGANLNLIGGYNNAESDEIIIIENNGTGPITGTFQGLEEGSEINFGDFSGILSYIGGDGNDLVLMGVPSCALAFTDQPQDVTLCQDETTLEFTVVASGTGILSYNWQALGNGLTEWTDVADQDGTATLSLNSPVQMESSGLQYRVVITDDQGTVDPTDDCNIISNAAILNVNPLPLPLISGPNSYVEGSGGVTLDAGPGFVDYLWSTGETTQTIIVVEGNYSVEVVDDNGCTGSSEAFTVSKIDSDLLITEIMYNPNGTDGVWEWIEIYNKGLQPIDLAGYVLDDNQGSSIASANIVSGIIPPQGSVILYDADLTQDQFKDAWGDVNLIPVTDFPSLGNNGGDTIGIWSSYLNYDGDNQTQLNVVEQVDYTNELPWPSDDGFASIYLTDLSADNQQGGNWALSTVDVATPLFTAYTSIGVHGNSGADIGSPGTPAEVDVEAPIITCSPNVTMSNDIGLCEASFPIIPATATDNVTLPENITIDFVRSDGALLTLTDPFQVGETIITWTATDEEGNTSESCEQIITVTDDEAPTAVVQNVVLELDALGEVTPNVFAIGAVVSRDDNCGVEGAVGVTGPATYTCANLGVNPVTLYIRDINGNETPYDITYTIIDPLGICADVTPPVITCPADVTVAFGESTDPSETGTATATDDIGIDGITFIDATVDQVITRTWTATDTSGNSASCNQLITIEPENDTTPPVAVCKDFTLVLDEFGLGSLNVSDVDGGSTDNVALASISISPSSFNELNIGENLVTMTVTDTSGNSASCTATVTVQAAPDTTIPEAICQDFTLVLDASGFGTISAADVDGGSTDNVGIASMSVSPSSFDESNIGTNQVILTVIDAAGNEDECTATVTVEAAPIVACANNLPNEDPNIVLPAGTRALGVDSALGISTDTNGSPCALGVSNQDSGQPWGTYRIAIRLADYGISEGDEMFIGVDGKSLTGTARMEVNRNNAPNTAIAQRTFGSDWSRYESTFIVPAGLTSLDLWFFSNYAQSSPGVALYDNLVVRNLSDVGENLVPIANAGNDVVIEDTDNNLVETVQLNATNSIDLDGNIISYSWAENGIIIATGPTPSVDFDLGVHTVELTVVDNEGAEDTDVVQISIVEPLVVTECPNGLMNEHPAIVLPLGTIGAGVDTALGIDSDSNSSPCALEVANNDAGQPWGSYRIAIRLTDYDIRVGDELNISVDGKSLTGTARMEINRNNAPNTSLGSKTFGSEWENYNTTFIVPSGVTTLDLWFFSNYAQSSAGVALYDNLSVINLSDTGDNLIPIANAGNDINVEDLDQDGSEEVSLNGSNSTDLDGEIISYTWRENGSVIASGESPTVTFNVGVHEVELTVMDIQNAIDTDTVRITVTDPLAIACTDDLENEYSGMILPAGTIALGVDSAVGISTDTNDSPCALQVSNSDNGQPWGSYRITIDLAAQGITWGDELYVSIDGKSLTGTARMEINRNNAPNTSLGSKTFGSEWENYNTTFIVPSGVTTLDLWFFSNYAQSTPGIALYDNLRIVKLDVPGLTAKNNEIVQPVNSLSLYPNPANIETTISFDQPTTVGTIQIFDVMGRLVRTIKGGLIDSNGSPVNVQEIPTGTYFVKTIDESGMEFQQQMLIERQ
ncbi:M4 family metallopeptidase [Maribacter confluentis]|uniref:M4 family metallopeptidase n=1 Tax=Maribacter confluentis TaxID=1656093 RepID=A0ABT8RLE9_9FLAO|nr:M4 family metallopeptidase [Maribacter confluentis]MDO1511701.1 M4 family metallopeptidase [Maribacter confluentis]